MVVTDLEYFSLPIFLDEDISYPVAKVLSDIFSIFLKKSISDIGYFLFDSLFVLL